MQLPKSLVRSPWAKRLDVGIAAVRAAGAALMELRGSIQGEEAAGGQLKTSTDLAAEGWVLGFIEGSFADELVLAEERFERAAVPWPGAQTYWTVDALDGTRSYVDGFAGFCVQLAFIADGQPRLGVIGEPVTGAVYVAAEGCGAWRLARDGSLLSLTGSRALPHAQGLRYVDSTMPSGPVGAMFDATAGRFVECGSVGLKICRVVEDAADIYAKRFNYKLWDVAPGQVLARETGLSLSSWEGTPIDFAAAQTHFTSLLVANPALQAVVVEQLRF